MLVRESSAGGCVNGSLHRREPLSTEFLDADDLRVLTGYARRTKQIEYLKRERIPFRVNARGGLVVRRNLKDKPAQEFELGPVR
jgi:hypothetical protein